MDELQHHGIKGQKWGKRRFQNEDGSLTAQGRARYNQELVKKAIEKKKLSNVKISEKDGQGLDQWGNIARLNLSKMEQKKLLDPSEWEKEEREYAKNNPQNYAAEQQDRSRIEARYKEMARYFGDSYKEKIDEIMNDKLEEYWNKIYGHRIGALETKKKLVNSLLSRIVIK